MLLLCEYHLHIIMVLNSNVFKCLLRFSHAQVFVTLWTIACQAPVHGILQTRILEGVAIYIAQ